MRVLILGNWHAGSTADQYAKAFRQLGHGVVTAGAPFAASDAAAWQSAAEDERWHDSEQVRRYTDEVLHHSLTPDFVTPKGALLEWQDEWAEVEAVFRFEAYGETPVLQMVPQHVSSSLIVTDSHTRPPEVLGGLGTQDEHLFIQSRRTDMRYWLDRGKQSVHWLPVAVDPEIWLHHPAADKHHDVAFCGATNPKSHPDRVATLEYLQAAGIGVHIQHAFGTRAAQFFNQARVVFNRSLAGDLNMRVVEALCCGVPLVSDAVDGLEDMGLAEALLPYHDQESALEAIQDALSDQHRTRVEQMATEGRQIVLGRHTYEHRVQEILNIIAHRPVTASFPPQTQSPIETTIIIPAYNHWDDCTAPLVDHLRHPSPGQHIEVLIIDDGSDDETSVRDQIAGWEVIHRERNGGFAAACNSGARQAQGRYLVFLNNDTRPQDGWLEPLVRELQAGAGIVGSLILDPSGAVSSAGLAVSETGTWSNQKATPAGPGEQLAITGACLAVSRDLFLRLGGFDEAFVGGGGCEDVDLCLRSWHAGHKVVLQPESVILHREGTTRAQLLPRSRGEVARNQALLRERWTDIDRAALMRAAESRRADHVATVADSRSLGGAPGDAGLPVPLAR